MKIKSGLLALASAFLLASAGIASAVPVTPPEQFTFTSCATAVCGPTSFGTVTLTQSGSNVTVDVVLNSGNQFVETGASKQNFFLFQDNIAGSTVMTPTATINGVTQTLSVSGVTNNTVDLTSAGEGTFTGQIFCTTSSDCNGASGPAINDLHFTVTSATIAQLGTPNASGVTFVADILCGATGCPNGGPTGLVDVNTPGRPVPLPATALMLGPVLGFGYLRLRRRRSPAAATA